MALLMDITCTREALATASATAARATGGGTLPILDHLLFAAHDGGLTLTGTNLELSISTHCPAQIGTPGTITVPAKKLVDICKALPVGADLRLRHDQERTTLTSGRSRFTLASLPPDDYPQMATLGGEPAIISLQAGDLTRLMGQVEHAIAKQDVRYYLNGLYLACAPDGLRLVATDGHRLATTYHPWSAPHAATQTAIIPYGTVKELTRALPDPAQPITLELGERLLRLTSGPLTLSSKLIDGRYPEWQRVIPTDLEHTAIFEREGFLQALTRLDILSHDNYHGTRAKFSDYQLHLVANNQAQEESSEDIDTDYIGPAILIGYNISYLSAALRAITTPHVILQFTDGNSPTIIQPLPTPTTGETLYVLMPMRL